MKISKIIFVIVFTILCATGGYLGYRIYTSNHPFINYAVMLKSPLLTSTLIKLGANVNAGSKQWNTTPLFLAAVNNSKELVQLLLSHGADPNIANTWSDAIPLHVSVLDKDIVELLLQYGANINKKNSHGVTPLHHAVWENEKDVVELLLQNKADANAQDNVGNTPLHLAAKRNDNEMYDLLIQYGAQPNQPNNKGETPAQVLKTGKLAPPE